jgi:hypothetical protein
MDGIDWVLNKYNGLIPFTDLRHAVWSLGEDDGSQLHHWLDLVFKPNPSPDQSGQFMAELTVLDYHMKPCPTSF